MLTAMTTSRGALHPAVAAAFAAALGAACVQDSTVPATFLSVSAASRSVSLREDSLAVRTDSTLVLLASSLAGKPWTAAHGAAGWLTLTTAGGTGTAPLRWSVDPTALWSGTWVDTITVTVTGVAGAVARVVDSVTVRDAPSQYITVQRPWRPGERDSVAAFIVRTGALGAFSDVAAQAVAQEATTVDVVPNPAWRPAGAPAGGVQLAPLFQSGWSGRGLDILVVFDSLPDNPANPASLGIQRDSLDWVSVRWWNPADSTWKGWLIRGTTDSVFPGDKAVNTTAFDASGLHSGVGGGESRLATGTYWEANAGKYRVGLNGNYGPYDTILSGPYTGGDFAVGQQAGRLNNMVLSRMLGTDTPATQTFSWDYSGTPIPSWRIRCYFAPVPPAPGFHQCRGSAVAALVRAAREGRRDARTAAAILFPDAPRRRIGRRRRRAGPLLAKSGVSRSGGVP